MDVHSLLNPITCISQDWKYIMKKRLFRNQPAFHSNYTSLLLLRRQPVHVPLSAGWKLVSIMPVVNACRRRTNSLLFDFGGRLICKLCHIVASHFPPRSPKQLVALLGEGSATYCRERAWMHRQITALKHSGRCVSCEIKLAGSFHRWVRPHRCLTFSPFSEAPLRSRRYANAHVSALKTFLIICRTGGPSRGMTGRPWRLSALRGCQWLTLPRAGSL